MTTSPDVPPLGNQQGTLEWFSTLQVSSEDGSALGKPKGWITCLGAIVEEIGSVEVGGIGGPTTKYQFSVTAPEGSTTRRIVLACEHRNEMQAWVSALREMVSTCARQPSWGFDSPSRQRSVSKAGQIMRMVREGSGSFTGSFRRGLSLRAELGTVKTVGVDDLDDDDAANDFLISVYQDDGLAVNS